jgi:hypothetical protein
MVEGSCVRIDRVAAASTSAFVSFPANAESAHADAVEKIA